MVFECIYKTSKKTERWKGKILYLRKCGSHYELRIESLSSITVIFGKTTHGAFACMPDFRAGCHLGNPKDEVWNTEKLAQALGEIDGITVATALYTLADKIEF